MTISTQQALQSFLGNGATTVFQFVFVYDAAIDIVVTYTDINGTTTTLSPSQYTLFLNPPATGTLWGVGGSVTYPLSGSPIANGTFLTVLRNLPLTQTTSISNQGDFAPEVIEAALDTLCMEVQQVSGRTGQNRGVWQTSTVYNYGDIIQDGMNGTNTLNYYMCIIANTSSVWANDLAAGDWALAIDVQSIAGYSASAAASAASALTSATNAANSAGTAGAAATTASASASNAAASATTATTQAGIASAAVSNALAAQTAAAASATAAASSAATSTTQANAAATSATTAATSATAAAGSAFDAAASAVLAASTLTATSTTSNSIGTGTKTYTIQTNKQFQAGQYIIVDNGANYNSGSVTSYNPATGSLVMSVSATGGSGTFTSWNVSVSGIPGANGAGTGTVTSVAVTTQNGVSATVTNPTSTPTIAFDLGAITPTSIATSGQITSTATTGTPPFVVASTTRVSNLNVARAALADTVTTNANLTGDVTSSGNATTIGAKKVVASMIGSGAATSGQVPTADGAGGVAYANQKVTSVATRTGAITLSNTDISGLGALATLSNVTESTISLSNVTTNNVSTSKHGFAPILPNDATLFLNGLGGYTVPGGGITATSNYVVLGAITIQYGKYAGGANNPGINFVTNFGGTPYSVTVTSCQSPFSVTPAFNIGTVGNSSFNCDQRASTNGALLTIPFYWVAIGPT